MSKHFTDEEKREAFSNILEQITQGKSVKKAIEYLREEGKPTCANEAFFKWLAEDEGMANQYACARQNRADTRFEKLDEITQQVTDGALEVDRARFVADTMKWQMGKEKAHVYGVKADITSKGESVAPKDATAIILGKMTQEDLEEALAEAQGE